MLKLQNELNVTNESSTGELLEKIKSLKSDIEKLRENEEDKTAVVTDFGNDAKDFYGIVYRSKAMSDVVDIIKKNSARRCNRYSYLRKWNG